PNIANAAGGDGTDIGAFEAQPATLTVNTTANTESITDTSLSLRDALQLADGNFMLTQMTPQVKAQVVGDPGYFDTINLTAGAMYSFKAADYGPVTADNFWYGPNALPAVSDFVTINGNGATLVRTDTTTDTAHGLRFFY